MALFQRAWAARVRKRSGCLGMGTPQLAAHQLHSPGGLGGGGGGKC